MDTKNKKIAKIIGKFEDCAYAIKTSDDISEKQELQKLAINYLNKIALDTNNFKNLDELNLNPGVLAFFSNIKNGQKLMDNVVACEIVTINKLSSIFNMVDSIKSEKLYHLVNHNNLNHLKYKKISSNGIIEERKEIKRGYLMERLAKFTGLIFSGVATDALTEFFEKNGFDEKNMPFSLAEVNDVSLVDKYIDKLEKIVKKEGYDLNVITPANSGGDFEIEDTNSYTGVLATANINTSWQSNSLWRSLTKETATKSFQLLYLMNGFTNENYKNNEYLEYNNGLGDTVKIKTRKRGNEILSRFAFFNMKQQNSEQKLFEQKLNALPFLSLIGNEILTDDSYKNGDKKSLTITDFLKINPLILGSDTYWLYKEMRDIKNSDNPELNFLNFILDYSLELSSTLKTAQKNTTFGVSSQTGFHSIAENLSRLIKYIPKTFSPNIINSQWDDKMFNKCSSIIDNIEEFISKVDSKDRGLAAHVFTDALQNLNPDIIVINHKNIERNLQKNKLNNIDLDNKKDLGTKKQPVQGVLFQEKSEKVKNQELDKININQDISIEVLKAQEAALVNISKIMNIDSKETKFVLGILDCITKTPDRLQRAAYYQELGCYDIVSDIIKGCNKRVTSGALKNVVSEMVHSAVTDFKLGKNDVSWFETVAKLISKKLSIPSELTKDNINLWIYQIEHLSDFKVSKELILIFNQILNSDKLLTVGELRNSKKKWDSSPFAKISSKILNDKTTNSNNKTNKDLIIKLQLHPKVSGYDLKKVITKKELFKVFKEILTEHNNQKINSKKYEYY